MDLMIAGKIACVCGYGEVCLCVCTVCMYSCAPIAGQCFSIVTGNWDLFCG